MCFVMKIRLFFLFIYLISLLDLLLIGDNYVYIKDSNRLMFNKNKCKNKKWFCSGCLQCFISEKVLKEHGKNCLIVNGCHGVKLEKGFTEFKNFNRQIPVPYKIYTDFECLLKKVDQISRSYSL